MNDPFQTCRLCGLILHNGICPNNCMPTKTLTSNCCGAADRNAVTVDDESLSFSEIGRCPRCEQHCTFEEVVCN